MFRLCQQDIYGKNKMLILIRPRISDYLDDWTRYFITKKFDRFNYKNLVSIFPVGSIKFLVIFTRRT